MTTRRFRADEPALDALYAEVADADLQPLWMLEGLMTPTPGHQAAPHVWSWKSLRPLIERSGELVGISRGGDRRVLSLTNPSLGGLPFATPTLWGAFQYLNPGEVAPPHRHSPAALRFVLEGEGVWTGVEGDSVAMEPGDLILTPAFVWHEHHNSGQSPMIWFDGLDHPLIAALDAVFFEPGPNTEVARSAPARSRSEARFGVAAGVVPVGEAGETSHSPLFAYRWADTDRALVALAAADPAHPVAVRFVSPTTGRDVMATMRCEMHRLPAGSATTTRREVGSSMFVVYRGSCRADVNGASYDLGPGDVLALTSWASWSLHAEVECDLFRVSDAPVIEAFGLQRVEVAQ